MPFDASGNFTRLRGNSSWAGDAAAHTPIKSDLHDQNDNDLAQGLSACITKTGATQPTADIPLAGHRIINVGAPVNPGDAATKQYVDNLSGFSTSLALTGADLNGRINFTAGTGVQGIGWTGADVAWIARLAVANQMRNQLVLNDKVDGTGIDTFRIDEGGFAYGPWFASPNTEYDGTGYRTIAAGVAAVAGFGPTGQAFQLWGLDTATAIAHQTAAIRMHSSFAGGGGACVWSMYKSSAAGVATYIQAYKGTLARWQIVLANGTAESGSNAGSDFSIGRFNDAGAYLGTAININRKTGSIVLGVPSVAANYNLLAYGTSGAGAVIGFTADQNYYGILGHYAAGTAAYSFYGNGVAYNSSAWTVSDVRAKSEIVDCDCGNAYHKVRAIGVRSYAKKGTPQREMGWLAQDIEPLIPEAVMDVGIPEHDEATRALTGGDTIKATNNNTMLATLWAAFQHQADLIEALEDKIAALEAKA